MSDRKYCQACDQSMPVAETKSGRPYTRTTPAGAYQVRLVCGHWSGVHLPRPNPRVLTVREVREWEDPLHE